MSRFSFFGTHRGYPQGPIDSLIYFLRRLMSFGLILVLAYFCATNSEVVLSVFRLCGQFLKDVLLAFAQM